MRDVLPEEIESIKKNLQIFNNLNDFFGRDWLETHFTIDKRENKHQIFWILVNPKLCSKLSNNLSIIHSNCDKFKRIINKLKKDDNYFNFHSLLTEIEVLAYHYRIFDKSTIEYEPEVENGKKVDIKLTSKDDEYFIEIFTIFRDEYEQELDSLRLQVKKELDKFDQPFLLTFGIELEFKEKDIDGFLNFFNGLLKNVESINEGDSFEYYECSKKLADVTFLKLLEKKKGCVGVIHSPVIELKNDIRIKNKVLSKLNQLPDGEKNVVIVNLSYILGDFFTVDNAFLGQYYVSIDKKTLEGTDKRHHNGIIHHKDGNELSMLIAYKSNNYDDRSVYHNLSAKNVIDDKAVKEIFIKKES